MENRAPIILQGQMDIECNYLFSVIENPRRFLVGSGVYYEGTLDGYPCIAMNSHYNQASSAMNTGIALALFHPLFVINQGTSGGHDPSLKVGGVPR